MAKLKEILWEILEDLDEEDFTLFKWHLNLGLENFPSIRKKKLKSANSCNTVDLMVQIYSADATEVTVGILRKIKRNDLVQKLSKLTSEPADRVEVINEDLVEKLSKTSLELAGASGGNHGQHTVIRDFHIHPQHHSAPPGRDRSALHPTKGDDSYVEFTIPNPAASSWSEERAVMDSQRHKLYTIRDFYVHPQCPPSSPGPDRSDPSPTKGDDSYIEFTIPAASWMIHRSPHALKQILKKYYRHLTLDPDTAHRNVNVFDNDRKMVFSFNTRAYPDHPDRFDSLHQALCSTPLTGRCYWELEWSGYVHVAVTYRGISRKGNRVLCGLGSNHKSWCLSCSHTCYAVIHNNITAVMPQPASVHGGGRVAVYLDHAAGSVSFYIVSSDGLIHLHTFNTTFTEPLYAGFGFGVMFGSVFLCDEEETEPLH